jgi:GTP cyclohydrolase IA
MQEGMEDMETDAASLLELTPLTKSLSAEDRVACLVRELLEAFGENPKREGLRRTPERVARMYFELLSGYATDPDAVINDAVFSTDYREMVLVREIEFYSLCEHHMLPFYGRVHVAYIPEGKVLGLSKFPRVVEMFARRLQIQEQMTQQIADFLQSVLQPAGLAVVVEGAHLCAMMRGVKKDEMRMVTSASYGILRTDPLARQDLLAQLPMAGCSGSGDEH